MQASIMPNQFFYLHTFGEHNILRFMTRIAHTLYYQKSFSIYRPHTDDMMLIAKKGGFKSDDLQNVKAILSKVKNAPSKNEIDKQQPETNKVLDKKIWKKDPSHATKLD